LHFAFGDNCTARQPAGKVVSEDNAEAVPQAITGVDREQSHEVTLSCFSNMELHFGFHGSNLRKQQRPASSHAFSVTGSHEFKSYALPSSKSATT
jgi:hypothetical protein